MAGTAAGPVQQAIYFAQLTFPVLGWTGELQVAGVNLTGQQVATNPPQDIVANPTALKRFSGGESGRIFAASAQWLRATDGALSLEGPFGRWSAGPPDQRRARDPTGGPRAQRACSGGAEHARRLLAT